MTDYIFTFLCMFFTDAMYTYYLSAVSEKRALVASWWAMVVLYAASTVTINYTTDHMMLIPALLGAFMGTYISIRVREKNIPQ